MRVQSALVGAFALISSTVVATANAPLDPELEAEYSRIVARTPCHPSGMHVIGASGAGKNNLHSYGLLESLIANLMDAMPHSTNFSLPFPKGQATVDSPDPYSALQKGTQNMRHYIKLFAKKCPMTPIVLAGYSSGSVITTNNLCGGMEMAPLPQTLSKRVIAVIGYGDETFLSGQSYNRGTCTAGQGLHPRDPKTCSAWAKKMRQYCDRPDPDCCGGNVVDSHFGYPKYDAQATAFVKRKFREFQKTAHKRPHKPHQGQTDIGHIIY